MMKYLYFFDALAVLFTLSLMSVPLRKGCTIKETILMCVSNGYVLYASWGTRGRPLTRPDLCIMAQLRYKLRYSFLSNQHGALQVRTATRTVVWVKLSPLSRISICLFAVL